MQFLDPKTTTGNADLGTEAGDRLPFSAEEKGAVWLEYTFPREIAGGRFYGRYQWTYNGNSLNGIATPTLQPSYQISDLKSASRPTPGRSTPTSTTYSTSAPSCITSRRAAWDGHDQHAADLGPRLLEELGR